MPNTITPYDPIFYAQQGLLQLEKALGLAARVFRGYDKSPQQPGSVIQVKRPGTFTAQSAPSSAQDLAPTSVNISLDQWYEVKFALTDKELNYTQEQIIADHIRPAAVALADNIDQALIGQLWQFPEFIAVDGSAVTDITNARKALFNQKVPLDDLHVMLNGSMEAAFLGLAAFSQWQGAGDAGVNTQMRGSLGTKFGFEIFSNQNVASHTSGTEASDLVGAINNAGGYPAGTTTIAVNSLGASATFKKGDKLAIAGHTIDYVVAADATATTGAIAALSITPGLQAAVTNTQVVTFSYPSGSGGTSDVNFGFHRNAMALAMAPLSTLANQLGARKVESVIDPITGLSLRSRMYYDGDNSKVIVALDVLYGVKVLDPEMGVRMMSAS